MIYFKQRPRDSRTVVIRSIGIAVVIVPSATVMDTVRSQGWSIIFL